MRNNNFNEFSKKRLMNNLEKKFNTTTIGSLSIIEEELGFLWGHGYPLSELNEDEKEMRELWKKVRTRILDLGNSNLRAAQSELAQYSFHWNRYITNFEVKGNKQICKEHLK